MTEGTTLPTDEMKPNLIAEYYSSAPWVDLELPCEGELLDAAARMSRLVSAAHISVHARGRVGRGRAKGRKRAAAQKRAKASRRRNRGTA